MPGVTYDAGALIAAARGDTAMWLFHQRALRRRVTPVVPAPVLAQAWRGSPKQARLSALLKGCFLVEFTPADAYDAGQLLGASNTADIVDAAVVVGAVARQDAVVTSDPGDLRSLADVLGVRVEFKIV